MDLQHDIRDFLAKVKSQALELPSTQAMIDTWTVKTFDDLDMSTLAHSEKTRVIAFANIVSPFCQTISWWIDRH